MKIFPNVCKYNVLRNSALNNLVQNWGFFSKEEFENNPNSLMMLDIDFGRKCSLSCPACFRRNNNVDNDDFTDLSYDELISVIIDAKNIGLKYIKICGAGEPFENPLLVRFAEELTSMNIGLSIFTKGHILGDDNLTKKIFYNDGINTADELAQKLFNLNTSILISAQSFDPIIQDKLVGNISGYTLLRNKAIELLATIGFNKCSPTRLALCSNPITRLNYPEIFTIYKYCRERNILPINAALMTSGNQLTQSFLNKYDVSNQEKEELYFQIYKYNIDNGIQDIQSITSEGISCLPGIHPCNQIVSGLYLTSNGNVVRCPGDACTPLGNTHNVSISKLWHNCKEWKYSKMYNVSCPYKDGITLPKNIYLNVLSRLEQSNKHYSKQL
ncbi:MAG: radical SAM protein [Bacteroidales bacterium]|jgi:MoaA/NifB/PqqE/SkfB family radical SAM enzyme